jgi:hypothetical protein
MDTGDGSGPFAYLAHPSIQIASLLFRLERLGLFQESLQLAT